jgi:hypothetical protein
VVDFVVTGLKGPHELVNVGAGSNGGVSLHYGGKSIGHHSCDFAEFIPAETDEGFG